MRISQPPRFCYKIVKKFWIVTKCVFGMILDICRSHKVQFLTSTYIKNFFFLMTLKKNSTCWPIFKCVLQYSIPIAVFVEYTFCSKIFVHKIKVFKKKKFF